MVQMPIHKYTQIAAPLKAATSNTPMKPGTRRTRCKKITPRMKANQLYLFENTPILKIDCFDLP